MEIRDRLEDMSRGVGSAPLNGQSMIFVVSDSTGEMAKLLISRLLAQYDSKSREPVVRVFGYVNTPMRLAEILTEAQQTENTLVFATLVQPKMIRWLEKLSAETGVRYVNVMDPLLKGLSKFFGSEARGVPGGGRQQLDDLINREFLSMVEGASFMRQHLWGQKMEDWQEADLILLGVSRVGKIGVASFLAQRGKKVATMNIQPGEPLPKELDKVDPSRIAIMKRDEDMVTRRRQNCVLEMEKKNVSNLLDADYADPERVRREIRFMEAVESRHPEWLGSVDLSYICEDEAASMILGRMRERLSSGAGTAPHGSLEGWQLALVAVPVVAAIAAAVATRAQPATSRRRRMGAGHRALLAGPGAAQLCWPLPRPDEAAAAALPMRSAPSDDRVQRELEMRREIDEMTNGGGGALAVQKRIFLVSDSSGETAKLLISRLLIQFKDLGEPFVQLFGHVTTRARLSEVIQEARSLGENVLIFALLADRELSDAVCSSSAASSVSCINALGPLMQVLNQWNGSVALGTPLESTNMFSPTRTTTTVNTEFFRMADAVQFMQQHISGLNCEDWPQADVVLLGLSRVGKETVAGYLAQLGVRTACVSVAPSDPVPPELNQLGPTKVVVLSMQPGFLVKRRESRIRELMRKGAPRFLDVGYANAERVEYEAEFLSDLVRQMPNWLGPIDVTYLAVEECASAVIRATKAQG